MDCHNLNQRSEILLSCHRIQLRFFGACTYRRKNGIVFLVTIFLCVWKTAIVLYLASGNPVSITIYSILVFVLYSTPTQRL